MSRPTMFATLVGSGVPADSKGVRPPIEIGQLVLVEVPHNCQIFSTDAVSARDIARTWFMLGATAPGTTEFEWELEFAAVWAARGIGGEL